MNMVDADSSIDTNPALPCTGGHPRVCADFVKKCQLIKDMIAVLSISNEDERDFLKNELVTSLSQHSWHPSDIVGDMVEAVRDNHEYQSIMVCVEGVNQPISNVSDIVEVVASERCRLGISAMLNHCTGGIIHFAINDNYIVEDGLVLEQRHAIDELRKNIRKILKTFQPAVDLSFVEIKPVNLRNGKQELTGQWRFDLIVTPHPTFVRLHKDQLCPYYRHASRNVEIPFDKIRSRITAEYAVGLVMSGGAISEEGTTPLKALTEERGVQTDTLLIKELDGLWRPNAIKVGAHVGTETADHEFKSLIHCVCDVNQPLSNEGHVVKRVALDTC